MPFSVVHRSGIDDILARLWVDSSDPAAITAAFDRAEHVLRFAPDSAGLDCGSHRELTVPPLTVAYTFSPDDCMVTIIDIRLSN